MNRVTGNGETSLTAGGGESLHIAPHLLAAAVAQTAERSGWEAAVLLIEQYWDRMEWSAPQHLLAAIRALPGAALVDRPCLVVAANYLQRLAIGGDPSRFNNDGRIDAVMIGGTIGLLDRLTLLTGRSAGARTSGDLAKATRAAEEARTALDRASESDRAAVQTSLPHLRLQWGRSFEQADAGGAAFEYEESYDLAMLTNQPLTARRAAAQRAWMHAENGQLNAAELWQAKAMDQPAFSGRFDAIIFLTSALLRLERGDRDGARRELARALGLGDSEHWAADVWVQSMVAHNAATATVAEAQLTYQLERHPGGLSRGGANGRFVRASRARIATLKGRFSSLPSPNPNHLPSDRVIAGAFALAVGKFDYALRVVRPAADPAEPPRTFTSALLITAAASTHLGRNHAAVDVFEQANALIDHERLYSVYGCIPPNDLTHLAALADVGLPDDWIPGRQPAPSPISLSRRELEVLALLTTRKSMPEIAEALFISPNTLKSTVQRLYRKLSADSRSAAIDKAQRSGLL